MKKYTLLFLVAALVTVLTACAVTATPVAAEPTSLPPVETPTATPALAGESGFLEDWSGVRERDPQRDSNTLRHNANFMVEVDEALYWVPAVRLGGSRYTHAEMVAIAAHDTPEQKQEKISTLYEALQLYIVSDFTLSDAVAGSNFEVASRGGKPQPFQDQDGIYYEFHKPGYDAVRTNGGCCAADSNWLNYILRDDYDEVGLVWMTGHVTNYIRQGEWTYFVDLTHQRRDSWPSTPVENGRKGSYMKAYYTLGGVHMTQEPERFPVYLLENGYTDMHLCALLTTEDLLVTGTRWSPEDDMEYSSAPATCTLRVIYDLPDDGYSYEMLDTAPEYDWSQLPDATIRPLRAFAYTQLEWERGTVEVGAPICAAEPGEYRFIVMSDFTLLSSDYTVESSDPAVCVCVRQDDGSFLLTGLAEGTAEIVVRYGETEDRFCWYCGADAIAEAVARFDRFSPEEMRPETF